METRTPAERRALLHRRIPQWRPRAIHEWLLEIAEEFPEREFLVTDDRSWSYREVVQRVLRVAGALHDKGVRGGDHVAILMGNYPEYVVLKHAISRLGAVLVPLNFMYKKDELAYVLRNSEAKGLITMTGFRGLDYLGMLDEIVPGWERGGGFEALPDLEFVVQFEAMAPPRAGVETFDAFEAAGAPLPEGVPTAGPDDPSIIFYTSGSTGNPKGVVWTHDQDARVGFGGATARAFADGWRCLSALPLYHAFGNDEVLNATMFVGGAVIARLTFDGDDVLDAIERHGAHELVTVPTMVIGVCEAAARRDANTESLVALLSAGSIAPVWLWERAIELLGVKEVTTAYGQTESGGGQVMSQPEDGIELVTSSVGRIKFAGAAGLAEFDGLIAEMRTADIETGELLPFGVEGELVSRGPINSRGYWKLPEEDAVTFRDGWVYSGDIGVVTAEGVVRLTGRKKEMIRSGGENYAPKEVEDLLSGHPAVSQAYVVGVPDEKWGEVGCAWLVPEVGARIDADELEALCRERLAAFKRPREFRVIAADQLPTTATSKVQKFVLVEWATAA